MAQGRSNGDIEEAVAVVGVNDDIENEDTGTTQDQESHDASARILPHKRFELYFMYTY